MHPILPAGILLSLLVAPVVPLTPPELAPFLRVISASVGAPGRVACRGADLSMQFKKSGLSPDAKSPVAFAENPNQIKDFLAEGKLVVCGEEAGLNAGASIAIIKEGAKPSMVVNSKNAKAVGVTLSDTLLKIARVQDK